MFTRRKHYMKKAKRISFSGGLPILALGLAFVGLFSTSGEAQKGNPKPPQIVCDSNGNCEYAEMNWLKSRVEQPCPDCQPKVYGPLMISESQLQIAGWNTGNPSGVFLCQFTRNPPSAGEYKVVWESAELDVRFNNVRIGDIDNDEQNEIVAIHTTTTVTGKGKNQQTTYSSDLLIFEDGDMREPTSRLSFNGLETYSGLAKEIRIADVDNDQLNELVVMKSGMDSGVFEVYHIALDHKINRLYSSEVYSGGGIWSLEVGNADNIGANEILLSRFMTTRPLILKFTGNGWVPVEDGLIDETGLAEAFNDDGTLNFNVIKVRDVDSDGVNEIIAGGNSGWLMIWNYIEGRYVKVFSEAVDPEHFTWALDVGNIDTDSGKEIVIGLGSGGLILDAIKIYKKTGTYSYYPLSLDPMASDRINIDCLRVGDLDGDGTAEIVTGQNGLTVYRYEPFSLVKIYNFGLGGTFEIK
jgi:hypothetical protein